MRVVYVRAIDFRMDQMIHALTRTNAFITYTTLAVTEDGASTQLVITYASVWKAGNKTAIVVRIMLRTIQGACLGTRATSVK
ncbi:hypothetical protein DPMN_163343 [Dreissena polymorpha]|uniref:Uncharacterized protein n=1 Tax=Dreissena polymorpha TaxID=45954 RepID=A0A9D4ET99_DREPO|nr:hypothetical protein DPMN_163343 [Dreissena polymorpha]